MLICPTYCTWEIAGSSKACPEGVKKDGHFHLAPPNLNFVLWPRTDIKVPLNYAEFDSALDCTNQLFWSNAPGGLKRQKHNKNLNFPPGGAKLTVQRDNFRTIPPSFLDPSGKSFVIYLVLIILGFIPFIGYMPHFRLTCSWFWPFHSNLQLHRGE